MKTLWKSFKITIAFCIFFSLFYILVLWIFAQFAGPNKGNAEVATLNGKVVGAANVGQMFTQDIYFWGRPSAGNYTADASGGSNKGPTNDEYLADPIIAPSKGQVLWEVSVEGPSSAPFIGRKYQHDEVFCYISTPWGEYEKIWTGFTGRVVEVCAKQGDVVNKGDVIAYIQRSDIFA